jgi:hypothetical protein
VSERGLAALESLLGHRRLLQPRDHLVEVVAELAKLVGTQAVDAVVEVPTGDRAGAGDQAPDRADDRADEDGEGTRGDEDQQGEGQCGDPLGAHRRGGGEGLIPAQLPARDRLDTLVEHACERRAACFEDAAVGAQLVLGAQRACDRTAQPGDARTGKGGHAAIGGVDRRRAQLPEGVAQLARLSSASARCSRLPPAR